MDKNESSSSTRKSFNKKKWRDQKYNKKFKKQQFEEKRSKAIMRHHFKQMKKETLDCGGKEQFTRPWGSNKGVASMGEKTSEGETRDEKCDTTGFPSVKRLNAYQQAEAEFQRKKEEKMVQKLEAVRKREEIKEALSKYNETKKQKTRVIRKKTKKGQPIMKERLEMLYEKIKKQVEK